MLAIKTLFKVSITPIVILTFESYDNGNIWT